MQQNPRNKLLTLASYTDIKNNVQCYPTFALHHFNMLCRYVSYWNSQSELYVADIQYKDELVFLICFCVRYQKGSRDVFG